jgi:hypothetical protein
MDTHSDSLREVDESSLRYITGVQSVEKKETGLEGDRHEFMMVTIPQVQL